MNHIKENINSMTVGGFIIRFITANLILYTIGFFTPDLSVISYISLSIVATILTTFDYLFNAIIGAMPYSIVQGIVGFFVSASILYFTQFFIPNFILSGFAIIIASLIYATVAIIVPKQEEI